METKAAEAPRFSLRVRGMLVLVVPILSLLGAVVAVLRLEGETREADNLTRDAVMVRAKMQRIRGVLADAETSVFSYLASGQRRNPDPLDRAVAMLESDPATLRRLAAPDGRSDPRLQEAARLIREELALLRQLREARKDAAIEVYGRLERHRIELSALLDAATSDLDRIFEEAGERRKTRYQRFAIVAILCCCVGPFGGLLINMIFTNRLVRRLRMVGANAHELAQGLPLSELPRGADEIAQLGRDMEEAAVLLSRREAGIRESEKRFRQLFDEAPLPYHETGRDGVITRVNEAECRLLGYTASQIVGHTAWDFIAPEERDNARRAMLEAIETGADMPSAERDYVISDGSRITVEIYDNLIRGDNGEIIGIRAALMDVTEHKLSVLAARKVEQYARELRKKNEQLARAAAAARAATEAKSRFLAGMSHELRTPLNSIIGFSELMYDGKVGPISDDHRDFLADILTSARHLLQLINDILDLSKIESGKFEFRPEPTDISRLAREVCDVISPLAAKKRIHLAIEAPEGLPAVIDPARVKQVMYNYLSNAVKFTPELGSVTCRILSLPERKFRIEVEDTGVGIASEDMPRLFTEFEQLSLGQRPGQQGAGLGLALTRRLVEGQGGSVQVRSTVGVGSLFSAIFPSEPPNSQLAARIGKSRIVLVVEDDVQQSRRLCQMLREAGYEPEVAYSRAEAAEHCAVKTYDAIALDILLPEASGWELLRDIRAGGLNSATPVVAISMGSHESAGVAYPVQDCLTKPVKASTLLEALERAAVPANRERTVLVVDDDASACHTMQATLAGIGYRAVCRHDGESGLAALASEHPSAVLLDLAMPGVDGFQFLHRMRCNEGPHPPVIVWTGKDLSPDERRRLQGLAEQVVQNGECTPGTFVDQIKTLVG
jgi:PAS domain S-box-containing protein